MSILIFPAAISCFVSLHLLQRKWLQNIQDARTISFLFNIAASIISAIVILLYKLNSPSPTFHYIIKPTQTIPIILLTVTAIFLWSISERVRFNIAANLEASVSTILNTLYTALAFLLGLIIYHDSITTKSIIGFFIILLANLLIIQKIKFTTKHNKAFIALFITTIVALINSVIETSLAKHVDLLIYSQLVWTIETLLIYIMPVIPAKRIKYILSKIGLIKIFTLAILNVVGYFLYLLALKISNLSTVSSVFASIPILTTFLAIYLLNERHYYRRKQIAAILSFLGIVLLSR